MQKNLEWLQNYETIILFFDNDDAGRHAEQEACQVLPPGKVKVARLQGDYKDASDALSDHNSEAIRRAIWDARDYRPDGIVEGKSLHDLVTTPDPPNDHDYPFDGLNGLFTVSDTENLQRSLQDLVLASPHSAGSLQLIFFKLGNGSVTWLLRNQTEELLLD